MNIIEKSRETVEQLLARRNLRWFRELPVPHRHQGEDAIVAQLPYPRWNDR